MNDNKRAYVSYDSDTKHNQFFTPNLGSIRLHSFHHKFLANYSLVVQEVYSVEGVAGSCSLYQYFTFYDAFLHYFVYRFHVHAQSASLIISPTGLFRSTHILIFNLQSMYNYTDPIYDCGVQSPPLFHLKRNNLITRGESYAHLLP